MPATLRPQRDPVSARPISRVSFGESGNGGPSLVQIFKDVIAFIETIQKHTGGLSRQLRDNTDRHIRGVLREVQELQHRAEKIKFEVFGLSRANFPGLQCLFEHPQCIALGDLQKKLSRIERLWKELYRILRNDLRDPDYTSKRETFEARTNGLSERIKSALTFWRAASKDLNPSPLCESSLRLINGQDFGVVKSLGQDSLDQSERSFLRRKGGLFQRWKCRDCRRTIKFYVTTPETSIEDATERLLPGGCVISYRAVACAKSHLRSESGASYGCLICLGEGQRLTIRENMFQTERGLAKHIGAKHNSDSLPRVFMRRLHFLKKSESVGHSARCDIRFLDE